MATSQDFADLPFQFNSVRRPTDYPHDFDIHVYFDEELLEVAATFRQCLEEAFSQHKVFVGDVIPKAVGPHPLPMFEANFGKELFGPIVLWLMHNRGPLSILVHEISGDDYRDHTVGALWLGKQLELKFEVFNSI